MSLLCILMSCIRFRVRWRFVAEVPLVLGTAWKVTNLKTFVIERSHLH